MSEIMLFSAKIEETLRGNKLKSRPNAGTGVWVSFLLPTSILIALSKNPQILSHTYKLATIASIGIIITNIILLTQKVRFNNFKIGIPYCISTIFMSFLFHTCLHRGYAFSFYSGLFSTYVYYKSIPWMFKTFPASFTFGEATCVAQGVILFFYTASVNITQAFFHTPNKVVQISTTILQVGIIGLAIIIYVTYKFERCRTTVPFYTLTASVFTFGILGPLHILLKRSPVLWIIDLLTSRPRTVYVILFWAVCVAVSGIVISGQIKSGRKANTTIRKAFHILVFIVYLTGLIDQCSVLYLASGIIFVFLVALEIVRKLNLPPLGIHLQDAFVVFSDEKDAGSFALTAIYLSVGCSLPIWIHPDTCDVTDSAGFNLLPLLSGILSIGIGDTMASVVGTWVGKYKWPKTKKTFEGTTACIVSQMWIIFLLIHSGYIYNTQPNIAKAGFAIVTTSLVEALTDQIDNLVLPLIMYIILF